MAGRVKVVIAVPERHVERLIQVNLERQGHEVFVAREATGAMRLIDEKRPNIAVLDPTLPNADLVRHAVGEDTKLIELGRGRSHDDPWISGGPGGAGGPGMPLPPGVVPLIS